MRIRKVETRGFGPFDEAALEPAEGMTVVIGANESGKSSWHAAMYAGLCGMRRGRGRPLKQDEEFAARYRPWNGERWEVSSVVDLPDGRTIELAHDLDGRVACTARDRTVGTDVSAEIIHDGAPDGSRWLGLERRAFRAVACVRQAEILAVTEHVGALQEHLQRAAATGGSDETAASALAAIDDYQRDHVGSERSNSTKPLMTAIRQLAAARQHRERAIEEHDDWLRREGALAGIEQRVRIARGRALVAAAAAARSVAATLGDRAARARQLAERHRTPPPRLVADDEVAEHVITALRDWEQRPRPQHLTGPAASELEAQLAKLPEPPAGDLEPDATVVEARQALVDARSAHDTFAAQRAPVETAVEAGGASESQLIDLARELEAPMAPVDSTLRAQVDRLRQQRTLPSSRRGTLVSAASAGVAVVTGLVLLAAGQAPLGIGGLLLGFGLATASAFALLRPRTDPATEAELNSAEARLAIAEQAAAAAQQRHEAAAEQVRSLGLKPDAAGLRHLADQLRRAEHAAIGQREWAARQQRLNEAVEGAFRHLTDALSSRGVDVAGQPDLDAILTTCATYFQACRDRAKTDAAARQRPGLEQALGARGRAEQRLADDLQRAGDAAAELRHAARAAGLDEGVTNDLSEAELVEKLGAWQQDRQQRRGELETARGEWSDLQALLDGRTLEEVEAGARRALERANDLADGLDPAERDDVELGDDPEHTVGELRAEADRLAQELATERGELAGRAESLSSIAEAEETVETAEVELARVRRLDETLQTTKRFLTDAQERVHRDLAPTLAEKVRDRLATVTGDRYRDVTVNPETLEVQVRDPEGRWRNAEHLSHGTAEQIFLLLRVSMSELLSAPDARCPLLLDDVTVQSDPVRTRAMLAVLHEISTDHQVVVFSQEDDVVDWAEQHLGERDRLIRLSNGSAR